MANGRAPLPRAVDFSHHEERLRAAYGSDVFEARIPEAADFVEAIARRSPIAMYKPNGASAKVVASLAIEIESRSASSLVARSEAA